jgi:hypothetical protein
MQVHYQHIKFPSFKNVSEVVEQHFISQHFFVSEKDNLLTSYFDTTQLYFDTKIVLR